MHENEIEGIIIMITNRPIQTREQDMENTGIYKALRFITGDLTLEELLTFETEFRYLK